jgi:hypothetical protein
MINYATEAHPTLYKARLYRSRLEARWAVFFDLMGWRFEYEPLDLGLWSPDFLLHGLEVPILCEVKPIDAIDADVCAKMACAAEEAQFRGELLLLGATPDIGGTDGWLGWLDDAYSCWLLGPARLGAIQPLLRLHLHHASRRQSALHTRHAPSV